MGTHGRWPNPSCDKRAHDTNTMWVLPSAGCPISVVFLSFFCWDGGIFWFIFFYIFFSSRARLNWSAWITRYYHRLHLGLWTGRLFFFLTSSVSAAVDISKIWLYILACVWLSWFPGVGHFAPSKWQQIHKCWQKGIERTLVTRRVYYTPLLRCHFAWLREDAPFKLQTTWKRKRNKKEKRQKKKDGTTSTDYISQDFLSR